MKCVHLRYYSSLFEYISGGGGTLPSNSSPELNTGIGYV